MTNKWFYYRDGSRFLVVFCVLSIILCGFPVNWGAGNLLFAAEQSDSNYKIVSLGHISAEQGIKFLSDAGIGTVSRLPSPDTLLITAQPDDLTKALVILRLVDSRDSFALREICPASEAMNLPGNHRIAAEVGDISIGTFSNPPDGSYEARAIIDVHGDSAIAIAPVWKMEAILSAIEKLSEMAGRKVAQKPPVAVEEIGPPAPRPEGWLPVERVKPQVEEPAKVSEKPGEVVAASAAVRSYEPQLAVDANEMLELDLPERLNIIDLLALVGEYLNLDYMYDEKKLAGQEVSLRLRGPIKVKDLYPLLESVLKFKGFAMARKGNLVTIVPSEEALNLDPTMLGDRSGEVQVGDVIVTRIFNLQYVDAESAKNLLSGMKLGADINTLAAEVGKLIVTDYAYRMDRIEELLAMIDKPGEPREFRFRQLRYTMAKTLAPKVKGLAEQLGTVSISIAAPASEPTPPTRGRAPARRTTPTPTPTSKPSEPTVYLDADERTNRILMIGLAEQLSVVESLIDSLDVEQQDLRTLKIYEVQYVDAEEVKNKLQELGVIGGGSRTASTRITRTTATRAGAAESPPPPTAVSTTAQTESPAEEPQVVIIESTNSLLVNATPEQHAQIAMILSYVDSQTLAEAIPYEIYKLENQDPEELAETLNKLIQETVQDKEGKIEKIVRKEEGIVIVPDKNTFSLIVYASRKNQEWIGKLIKQLDKRRPQVLIDVALVEITQTELFEYDLNIIANAKNLVTNNLVFGADYGLISGDVGNNLEGGWNMGGDGTIKGFYGEDKIQAILSAMNKKDYGRILAQPKVLVNDNEEGVINTSERTYVKEDTTSYTSEGVPVTTSKWTEYPAKIELSITPNISEGELLRLAINMTREDFEKKEDRPPDYRTSTVNTVVTVPNGSTIILGGLTKLNQNKGGSKVPLLGDVPLVGGLFRTVANSNKTSKLYIFVKANILRPDETVSGLAQLRKISEKDMAIFEESERKFQEHQAFPCIKPKTVDPLRVLEPESY